MEVKKITGMVTPHEEIIEMFRDAFPGSDYTDEQILDDFFGN